jgi:hypothetical protein
MSDNVFFDVLRNTEVIKINKMIFDIKKDVLESWSGNVIVE